MVNVDHPFPDSINGLEVGLLPLAGQLSTAVCRRSSAGIIVFSHAAEQTCHTEIGVAWGKGLSARAFTGIF